ncbi:MAG TPA: hypothetical protein VI461_07220 [Chitinophagaceae bacterium]|nr:hypothetical protein [Chitinophagaceae bacterium]
MGFSFTGIFTNTKDNAVIEAAKKQWPFCTIYRVQKPFEGISIYRDTEKIDGTYIQSYDEKDKIEKELQEFSSPFPDITFIHLRTDCHGGDCTYDGFACRHGKIILDNRGKGPEKINSHIETEKLREVLATLNVYASHFEPFERGFFDNEENIIYPGKKFKNP